MLVVHLDELITFCKHTFSCLILGLWSGIVARSSGITVQLRHGRIWKGWTALLKVYCDRWASWQPTIKYLISLAQTVYYRNLWYNLSRFLVFIYSLHVTEDDTVKLSSAYCKMTRQGFQEEFMNSEIWIWIRTVVRNMMLRNTFYVIYPCRGHNSLLLCDKILIMDFPWIYWASCKFLFIVSFEIG